MRYSSIFTVLCVLVCCRHAALEDILTVSPPAETDSCELIDYTVVHYCKALDSYNLTSLPNNRDQTTQAEAFKELSQYKDAILSNCSGAILNFLCSYYIPFCFESNNQIMQLLPCQNLCLEVYANCNDDVIALGASLGVSAWPSHLNCSLFPAYPAACFGPQDPSTLVLPALIPGLNAPAPTKTTTTTNTDTPVAMPSEVVLGSQLMSMMDMISTYDLPESTSATSNTASTSTVAEPQATDTIPPGSGSACVTTSYVSFLVALISLCLFRWSM